MIVYTISTNISGMKGKGDKVLERIAEATGGRLFPLSDGATFRMRFSPFRRSRAAQYAAATKPRILSRMDATPRSKFWRRERNLKARTPQGILRSQAVTQTRGRVRFVILTLSGAKGKGPAVVGSGQWPRAQLRHFSMAGYLQLCGEKAGHQGQF